MRAFENLTLLWVLPTRVTVFIDFAVRYLSPFRKAARIHSSCG